MGEDGELPLGLITRLWVGLSAKLLADGLVEGLRRCVMSGLAGGLGMGCGSPFARLGPSSSTGVITVIGISSSRSSVPLQSDRICQ